MIGRGPVRGNSDDKVALATLGIDLDQVRDAVGVIFGPGALTRSARGGDAGCGTG